MTFVHDVELALAAVVELVNTDPAAGGEELLPDIPTLRHFVRRHQVSDIGQLSNNDLVAVRGIRTPLRHVFLTDTTRQAAGQINDLLSSVSVRPRLTDHDGYGWHMHYFVPGASLAEHIVADGAMALAFVVTAGEHERLETCAAPDCSRVLVDLSRNRSKRYCDSRTCGNRLHVAAYRERRRAAAG